MIGGFVALKTSMYCRPPTPAPRRSAIKHWLSRRLMARPDPRSGEGRAGRSFGRKSSLSGERSTANALDHPKYASARNVRLERTAAELCCGRAVPLVALV